MGMWKKSFGLFLLFLLPLVAADPSLFLPLQGRLTNASTGLVLSGLHNMTFELYQASSGGSPLWTENMSTNLSDSNGVSVVNGIFDVLLGSNASLGSVNFTAPLWLQIKVGGDSLETLSPRMPLASAPYAFAASRLYANVSVNENVAYISKTGTGAGNLLNLSNSGTGFDIEAQSFTLKNGVLISLNTTALLHEKV